MRWRHYKAGMALFDNIIFDCRSLLLRSEEWELQHVFRERNQSVDVMAKEGVHLPHPGEVKVFENPPPFEQHKPSMDNSGTYFTRKNFYASLDMTLSDCVLNNVTFDSRSRLLP